MRQPKYPLKLFKYMEIKWLDALLQTKEFYINHLKNYKQIEMGNERGDDKEGHLATYTEIEYLYIDDCPKMLKEVDNLNNVSGIHVGENVWGLTIKDTTSRVKHIDSNYHILCFCMERNDSLKDEFGEGLLIVYDVDRFFNQLNKVMRHKGYEFVTAEPCRYIQNRMQYFNETNILNKQRYDPYLVKDISYSWQNEFRAVWKKQGKPNLEPVFARCPNALKYCKFERLNA